MIYFQVDVKYDSIKKTGIMDILIAQNDSE
jgi:hypothetical protein